MMKLNPEADLIVAAEEALAALYGAREIVGQIGNIQHAIDLLNEALDKRKDNH